MGNLRRDVMEMQGRDQTDDSSWYLVGDSDDVGIGKRRQVSEPVEAPVKSFQQPRRRAWAYRVRG